MSPRVRQECERGFAPLTTPLAPANVCGPP